MKKHAIQFLTIAAVLAAAMAYRYRPVAPRQQAGELSAPLPVEAAEKPRLDVRAAIPPPPKPVILKPAAPKLKPQAALAVAPPQVDVHPPKAMTNQQRAALYWQNVAKRFERQSALLDREADPAKRMKLIHSLARNVRVDTLKTLEWAMELENPTEQRAALDAINQNALVGIGARIQTDETGWPKIMDTTVLSALGSTGMTEPGDYISGMVNGDGTIIDFKDRPIQEVVQMLRGQPGTEVLLRMERTADDGQTAPYSFDVPVLRSMIIVQPPF